MHNAICTTSILPQSKQPKVFIDDEDDGGGGNNIERESNFCKFANPMTDGVMIHR